MAPIDESPEPPPKLSADNSVDTSPGTSPDASADTGPGTAVEAQLAVVDRPDEQRYELHLDGERVGLVDYSIHDGVVTIPHVETNPAHRGKNFAARLMAGVLDDIRSRELTVRPLCPYADAYMQRNPETADLRAD